MLAALCKGVCRGAAFCVMPVSRPFGPLGRQTCVCSTEGWPVPTRFSRMPLAMQQGTRSPPSPAALQCVNDPNHQQSQLYDERLKCPARSFLTPSVGRGGQPNHACALNIISVKQLGVLTEHESFCIAGNIVHECMGGCSHFDCRKQSSRFT